MEDPKTVKVDIAGVLTVLGSSPDKPSFLTTEAANKQHELLRWGDGRSPT
jgi:hypothetical protein